jgi:hypothetical protein
VTFSGQLDSVQQIKRRSLFVLGLGTGALALCLILRFVPVLDDVLSGRPQYVRILTESFAQQLAQQTHLEFPVIVEKKEDEGCQSFQPASIPDNDVRGSIYVLTYSEAQRLTCITTYLVPLGAAGFADARTISPAEGENYGPRLLDSVKAVAFDRSAHVYAPEYLRRLHWRYKQHFPLSPDEAASLASRSYQLTPKPADGSGGIELSYQEIRAEVGKQHRRVNFLLALLLACLLGIMLTASARLLYLFRSASQYFGLYRQKLTPVMFLSEDLAVLSASARQRYFEQQQTGQERLREDERQKLLRIGFGHNLRSALPNLQDGELQARVGKCLAHESQDLETMKALWMEIQERTGRKTPLDRLRLLVESVEPYCSAEECQECRDEAFGILSKSGFRAARKFVIAAHERFKLRAREMEELMESDQNVA